MIESLEEFNNKYNKAVIVNYDMESVFDYGVTYRNKANSLERFRKDKGKYITYPYIQPYLKLEDNDYSLFIIKNNEMFKLKKGVQENTYIIDSKIDVDINIFNDKFFDKKKIKDPANRSEEPIYIIEE